MLNDFSSCEPSPHVRAAIDEHGIVLLDTDRGALFAANRVGAEIWSGLQQRLSCERIAAGLTERYGIGPASALADTTTFVGQLATSRLVMRRNR